MDTSKMQPRIMRVFWLATVLFAASSLQAADRMGSGANPPAKPLATMEILNPDKGEQTVAWEQLLDGSAQITVLNSSKDAHHITATASFPIGGATSSTPGIDLQFATPAEKIDAGKMVRIPITLSNSAVVRPQPGTYVALVKLQSDLKAEPPVALPLKIVVSEPRPGTDKIFIISTRGVPFSGADSERFSIPLAAPVDPSAVCEDKQRIVGFLHRDPEGWATVRWKGVCATGGVPTALIQVDGLSARGRYEGSIALPGVQDKTQQATLTILARDCIAWPILTIIFGIALAWLAKWYVGLLRVVWGLQLQETKLATKLDIAKRDFADAAGEASFNTYGIDADVNAKRGKIRGELTALRKTRATSLDGNVAYKTVMDELASLTSQIQLLPSLASVGIRLKQSKDAIGVKIRGALIIPQGVDLGSPALFVTVAALLTGEAIRADEIGPLIKIMEENFVLLQAWEDVFQHAQEASAQYIHLSGSADVKKGFQAQLQSIRDHLSTMWYRLWRAVSKDEIAALSAAGADLEAAAIAIEQLTAEHKKMASYIVPADALTLFQGVRNNLLSLFARMPRVAAPPNPADDRIRARTLGSAIRLGDWASILLAFLIAVITGLNNSYWGKAFGTVEDYAVLFLWAAGTKVGVDIVTSVADRLSSYV